MFILSMAALSAQQTLKAFVVLADAAKVGYEPKADLVTLWSKDALSLQCAQGATSNHKVTSQSRPAASETPSATT